MDNPAPASESSANLAGLVHHIRTFWPAPASSSNLVLLHYDDLQADLEGQMRQLGRRLRIDVPKPRWPQLVAAARFGEMRRRSKTGIP